MPVSRDRYPELLTRMENRGNRVKIGVTIASGAIIIMLMFAIAHYYNIPEKTNVTVNLSDITETLIKKNTTIFIKPNSTAGFHETLNYNSTLDGRFNSTGEVTFYVLNQTEYLSQSSSGSLAYIYTTGTTTNHSVQVALQSGTYYLEFYNTNDSNPDTVQLTEPFTISFST